MAVVVFGHLPFQEATSDVDSGTIVTYKQLRLSSVSLLFWW